MASLAVSMCQELSPGRCCWCGQLELDLSEVAHFAHARIGMRTYCLFGWGKIDWIQYYDQPLELAGMSSQYQYLGFRLGCREQAGMSWIVLWDSRA